MMAATAMAGVTDVTPKAYNWDSGLEIPFVNAYSNADWGHKPWNPSAFFATKHPELYKDGLVLMIGPAINANWDSFLKGTKVVNLGGEVGKVLCFGGTNSNAQAALKARGIDVELPSYETSPGYMIPFWHADPEVTDAKAGGVDNPCRIQIVLNIFENSYLDEEGTPVGTHFQPYFQTGSNGTKDDNNTPDRAVYSKEFCYNWGEAEAENHRIDMAKANGDDLALWNTEEGDGEFDEALADAASGYVWNPNRWLVLEWDAPFGNPTDDGQSNENPLKIKMEMPELNGATVFIKSIKFLMKDKDEAAIPAQTRRRSWMYMDVNPASVSTVISDIKALNVKVDGTSVSFADNAKVYSVNGTNVANAAAGESVSLAPGFYIATDGKGQSVKFVVK